MFVNDTLYQTDTLASQLTEEITGKTRKQCDQNEMTLGGHKIFDLEMFRIEKKEV